MDMRKRNILNLELKTRIGRKNLKVLITQRIREIVKDSKRPLKMRDHQLQFQLIG
jgi:hypothetical protein